MAEKPQKVTHHKRTALIRNPAQDSLKLIGSHDHQMPDPYYSAASETCLPKIAIFDADHIVESGNTIPQL
jgi:hypothetical protein